MIGPIKFTPWLRTMVWGGSRISKYKQLDKISDGIGESWEISAVEGHESVVEEGKFKGKALPDLVMEYKEQLVGHRVYATYGDRFPLLIKLIDAQQDLSIQVHPNDELARELHGEGQFGKTEMWYVIDAAPGAFLYSGMRSLITPEEYRRRVADGTICEVLAKHKVKAGDVFFIPAGRVHAICSGILLAEVQQTSDWTYRIFDYNRLGLNNKPRELHTENAAKAIDFRIQEYRTCYEDKLNELNDVLTCPYFSIKVIDASEAKHLDMSACDSFVVLMALEGSCRVVTHGGELTMKTGESCLIPACETVFDVVPLADRAKLLVTTA